MPIFLSAYFILRTRQEMYVSRNNEVHLCNHCCSRRAINITYCKSVFVTLGMQHAMRMRHIVICGLPPTQHFSTLSHKSTIFAKELLHIKYVFFEFLYSYFLKCF